MRFSIVIPNFNYAEYVGAAIRSALAVDWDDLEVIVVDDGSTDGSQAVIRSFGDKIISIFQANATQRVACNVGFARSTGDVVLFLDSDDLVDPSIGRELAAVWRPGVSKVQFQMMRMDESGKPKNSVFPGYNPLPSAQEVREWVVATTAYPSPPGSGNIYGRTFLEKIFPLDASCGSAPDSACIVAAPFLGDVVTVAKPLVFYRVHDRNDSDVLRDNHLFAREIERARFRFRYSSQFFPKGSQSSEKDLFNSLPLLEFRVASLRLTPKTHPLKDDSWARAFKDAFRVPWTFPAATPRYRFLVSAWSLMTLLAPPPLARELISFRYKP